MNEQRIQEQRIQAYKRLIKQLLECPQGQEADLVQANAELLDAGLLNVMEPYAEWLESQGNSDAGRLRRFGLQLAQALELGDASRFLVKTLQLVAETQGNPQQIYPIWAQQQAQFNAELLAVMPTVVAQLFEGNPEQQPAVAADLGNFGNLINQFPLGIRWLNLELGIAAYESVLQVCTREAFPHDWATTQNNLAIAYSNRIRGERAENLELAISASESALQVCTRDAFPEQWAMTQNNLALAYNYRIRGERAENLEQAIKAYGLTLQVYTREAFPQDWAMTQNNFWQVPTSTASRESGRGIWNRRLMPMNWHCKSEPVRRSHKIGQ